MITSEFDTEVVRRHCRLGAIIESVLVFFKPVLASRCHRERSDKPENLNLAVTTYGRAVESLKVAKGCQA
jgi:hypothetical protein